MLHGLEENCFLLAMWDIGESQILREKNEKTWKSAKTGKKESDKTKRT